jgi:hypothetical protein
MPGSTRVPREALVGDPFLGVLAHALGRAGKFVKGKLGPRQSQASFLPMIQRGMGHRALPPIPPAPGSAIVATSRAIHPFRGSISATSRLIPGPGGTLVPSGGLLHRRRRRMNSLNLRALKRALRRVKSFEKIARKVIRPSARQHHFRRTFPARRKR